MGRIQPVIASNYETGQRDFRPGERVKIARKTRVVDKERANEGMHNIPVKDRPELDVDVTGAGGEVVGGSYTSPSKGELCVPVQLPGVSGPIAVRESSLERDPVGGSSRVAFVGPASPEGNEYLREKTRKQAALIKQMQRERRAQQRKEAKRER
jgi:hypothetical protein